MPRETFASAFLELAVEQADLAVGLRQAVSSAKRAGAEAEQGFRQAFKQEARGATDVLMGGGAQRAKFQLPELGGFAGAFKKGVDDAGGALEGLGAKAGKVAGLLLSPLSLGVAAFTALAGAIYKSVTAGLEFDREFTKVAVFLDRSQVNVEGLRRELLALDPALGTPTERVKVFRQAFMDTGSEQAALQITKVALALGKVLDADPARIATLIGSMADAFGVGADQADRFGDVLFTVAQKGGGAVEELEGGIGRLADAMAELGQGRGRVEEIGAALIALGEVSGAAPARNMQALEIALRTVAANAPLFRELGIDVGKLQDENGLLVGSLLALREASGGIPARLKEIGVPARNVTTILKLFSEEGLEKTRERLDAFDRGEYRGAALKAFAERSKTVSSELEKLGVRLDSIAATGGEALLSFFRDKGELPIKTRLEEVDKQLQAVNARIRENQKLRLDPGSYKHLTDEAKRLNEQKQALVEISDAQKKATEERPKPEAAAAAPAEGLSRAEEKRLAELAALERGFADEREAMTGKLKRAQLDADTEIKVAVARSESEKLQIQRGAIQERATLATQELDARQSVLEREREIARTSTTLTVTERRQKETELTQDLARLAQDRAMQRVDADKQLAVIDEQIRQRALADEDRAFEHRLALGQTSLQQEIDRYQIIAVSADRTADARMAAEERVHRKEQELRDKSRTAALGLLGEVEESFKTQGITQITKEMFEQRVRELQEAKVAFITGVQTQLNVGGALPVEALKQAVGYAGELEKTQAALKEIGGLGNMFTQAFAVEGPMGQAISQARALYTDFLQTVAESTPLRGLTDQYASVFDQVAAVVDRSVTTIQGRIASGHAAIVESLFQQFRSRLTDLLDGEARRF